MTLVLSTGISGRFVIMTSDTRQVKVKYKQNEDGEIEIDRSIPPVACDEKDTKVVKLNDRLLAAAGGSALLANHLKELLQERVMPQHDLDDCKEILQEIIDQERANLEGPDYLCFLDVKNGVTVLVNGFSKDGKAGLVMFTAGKDTEVTGEVYPKGSKYELAITPTPEYHNHIYDMFHIPEFNDDKTFEGLDSTEINNVMFKLLFDRLMTIHGVFSYNHQIEISPDFELHILTFSESSPTYEKNSFDLTDTHKMYDKLRKQLDS